MSIDLTLTSPEIEKRHIIQYLNHLSAKDHPEVILCSQSTTSTNDDAAQLLHHGIERAICLTQHQTQGRGQRQHQWQSFDGNIFISFLMPLERMIDGRLALECGLHILQCPTLSVLYQQDKIKIKWANDLYSEQGKWAGILIEPQQRDGRHFAIIGIGINVAPVVQKSDIHQKITSLSELGLENYHRQQFIAELYLTISQAINSFHLNCPNLAARFNANAMFLNQHMHLQRPNQTIIQGIYHGIQADGALLLQGEGEKHDTAFYDVRLLVS